MKLKVYAILIVCVNLWASNFIIGAVLVNYWSALHVTVYRLLCICLFLGIIGFPTIRKARIRPKQWLLLCLAAILGVSINHLSFFKSLESTSPITAAYILALTPIMTGIINRIVRGEKKGWLFWLGSVISFTGVGIIISAKQGAATQFGIGEVFSFCTMLSFAIFLVLLDVLRKDLDSFSVTFFTSFIGCLALLPFLSFAPIVPKQIAELPMILLLIISAILVHGVSNLVWNANQHKVGSTNAAILLNLEPIITMLLSAIILHAIIQSSQIIGGVLVLAGILISVVISDKLLPLKKHNH
ncbi:DMT family transporter [Bacillus ndiopicus]|uniref:DMT family transporter n=1 Tax=Bacillus ndiopicus TaxID=1347368 RepID=UPI0005A98C62|nr:DMT family transporter [Bacillus ndiopicus]